MSDQINYNSPTYVTSPTAGAWSTYALTYNGSNQASSIPTGGTFDISAGFTVVVAFTGGASQSGLKYLFSQEDSAGVSQTFAIWVTAGNAVIYSAAVGGFATVAIPDDDMHEVAFTFDATAGAWAGYLDGTSFASGLGLTLIASTSDFYIAAAPAGHAPVAAYYSGTFDDVMISPVSEDSSAISDAYIHGFELPSIQYFAGFEEGPPSPPPPTNNSHMILRKKRAFFAGAI